MMLSVLALAISGTICFPASGATNVCADTPLNITFDAAPTLGATGMLKISRASDNAVVDTIDLSLNAVSGMQARTIGVTSYNTFPVLVTGNTAAIFPRSMKRRFPRIPPRLQPTSSSAKSTATPPTPPTGAAA